MGGFAAAYKEGALPGDTFGFSNVSTNSHLNAPRPKLDQD